MNDLPRVHRPCSECPWRRDALPERFPACRYEALQNTAGSPGREAHLGAPMFACHKTPDGQERACASWLVVMGREHLGVRYAIITGSLPAEALNAGDDWPELYESYEELSEANGLFS